MEVLNSTTSTLFNASNDGAAPFYATSHALNLYNTSYPWYFTPSPQLLSPLSDTALVIISPIIAYWAWSLLFHYLDVFGTSWKWLDPYRIHESSEVVSRNRASRGQVVWAVLLQQAIQTGAAVWWTLWFKDAEKEVVHVEEMVKLGGRVARWAPGVLGVVVGEHRVQEVLSQKGPEVVWCLYWWGIPLFQLVLAMFIIDTHQYFLHRFMHTIPALYRRIHSVHHRLYVPYAFGALYNHPLEGFLLDTLGAALAEELTGMKLRQAMFLFCFSTMKTVDDHCGYKLWFDPFQAFFGNTADYHDIHHQQIGIKSNFSQPYFIHWDVLLGTRMTRDDIARRRKKVDEKSQ